MAFLDTLTALAGGHTGTDYSVPFADRLSALASKAGGAINNAIDTTGRPVVSAVRAVGSALQGPEAPPVIDTHGPVPSVSKTPIPAPVQPIANTTPTINQRPISFAHQLEAQTIHDFPFADIAKGQFKDVNFNAPPEFVPLGADNGMNKDNIQGQSSKAGDTTYNTISKFLPDGVAAWLADRAKNTGADQATITIDPKGKDPAEQVLSHEMLHHLFDKSPMSAGGDIGAKAGTAWLNTWDATKQGDQDSVLHWVDSHIDKSGYDLTDPQSIATERYAYLGQEALKYGIDIIPKQLQPYYYGVVDGAPKPTEDQLGSKIDPLATFDIKIGGADNYKTGIDTSKLPQPGPHLAPVIDHVEKTSSAPPGVLRTLLTMESSMANDTRNQNAKIGRYAWLAGMTNIAKKDLEQAGNTVNYNTRQGTLKAAADFWSLLKNRYPDESDADLYFNHYNGVKSADTPERRAQFDQLVSHYSSTS